MVLCPAPPDTGIVFLADGKRIKAVCDNVGDTTYATTLQDGATRIRTVEHLLAALAGLSIDNAYVELDGPEVPIMDGSAWPFIEAVREAGITVQGSARRYLKIIKPVTVHDGDKSATLLPSPVSRITYRIDFDHPAISDQSFSMDVEPSTFTEELAGARTFGFMRDVEMLQKAGLARGGSLENAVVMDDEHILNEEGLRYHNEFVRHKMLDAVGDLSLVGMPIIGHLVADKSGHWLNHRLVLEVLSHPDSWMVLEGEPAFEETRAYMEA
jgi:UDP-3-O-[3-hydroxymyristoyl] N-acetylglucosamine deacetylase